MSVFSLWQQYQLSHRIGDTVQGKVVLSVQVGVWLELSDGIEGHIDIIDLELNEANGNKVYPTVGSTLDSVITRFNESAPLVHLSTRKVDFALQETWIEYRSSHSIGDTIPIYSIPNYWPVVSIAEAPFRGTVIKGYYSREYDLGFKAAKLLATIEGYDDRLLQVLISMPPE
jgi:hypothetical protein